MIGIYNTISFYDDSGAADKDYEGTLVSFPSNSETTTLSSLLVTKPPSQNLNGQSRPIPETNYCPFYSDSYCYIRVGKNTTVQSQATRYSRSLSPVRYGYTYDFRTGRLTTTYAVITLDSTLTWSKSVPSNVVDLWVATITGIDTTVNKTTSLMTQFAYDTSSGYRGWGYFDIGSSGTVRIETNTGRFADAAAFGAWLDEQKDNNKPVQLLYPLATPTINTYTSSAITLADGTTNIWSESGYNVKAKVVEKLLTLKRPSDLVLEKEDIYAGTYTTCVGSTKADRIGWKYKDTSIDFDELTPDELGWLMAIRGAVSFRFDDVDGAHDEQVIKNGLANVPTRLTMSDGTVIWKNAKLSIKFIDAHN